ncbi:iron uptake porin [Aetokthonos hydrillicola Thurmond2011]|jgi:hypothetical protein|uniref:Iron uptake porin n=1 Tax=Aetokthonos hydrillicola Thurmond2011 TaxID=2712845 RepID=A0AAP5IBW5_9CYAN|nr:iron uptake porin [Aetokthonos hydrillicola]MBO3463493.1 carbohydrate porin [Aetokthonos hydrillicola CCALA 1050]MBW4590338.1 iron uptake porin [Aetokthonos hydrillicola CCALA 1050]MDR9896878.1 iron uptake porin [Aetokthonos hydrillicola Thurmond2011]
MPKVCNVLLVFPAILVATFFVLTRSLAAKALTRNHKLSTSQHALISIEPIDFRSSEDDADDGMSQINSVSELSDVQSTDWVFQALQSLGERYGCLTRYPNRSYRGNRVMTRYEFATGLNACLNRVNELITTASSDLVSEQDLLILQNLRQQFAGDLAILQGRVNPVEAKVAELQAHQFSTTTKLDGTVVIASVSVFAGDNARGQKINTTPILANRARLNFSTSFTGKDQLRTRLQATNSNALSGSSTFTPEGELRFSASTYSNGNKNNIDLDELSYTFLLGKNTKVVIDGHFGTADDFTDTVNSFLDGDGDSGALSNFGTHNPIYNLVAGSGIAVTHEFSDNAELTLGYLASESNDPSHKNGLFNGPYGAIGQLTIKLSENFTIGLTYVNSYNNDLTVGSNRANLHSALLSNSAVLPSEIASSPSRGTQTSSGNVILPTRTLEKLRGESLPTSTNSYGIEASYQINRRFVVGGWVGYTNTRIRSKLGGVIPPGELDIWNYALTLAFPDLGKKGSLGGIIVGMEPKVTDVSVSLRRLVGKDPMTSYHIETFYQYPVTDNIAITPGIIYLTAPDHNSRNAGDVLGVIRSTLTF